MTRRKKTPREQLREYVGTVRDLLYLQPWRIEVTDDRDRDCADSADAAAEIEVMQTRKVAALWFYKNFAEASDDDRRQFVIHELMHIHFAEMQHTVERFEQYMNAEAYAALYGVYMAALERCVDQVAILVAPTIPLPPDGA